MQLGCPRCGHLLEYSNLPPRFCSNCGVCLDERAQATTPTVVDPPPTGPIDEMATISIGGPRAPIPHPENVGGYRLLRPLGGGGMGTVYEAEETSTGRRVALKLIRPDFADSDDAVDRFRREGRLASTILHPRCVFVLAADEEAGRPYIVMELMPGSTLHDLIEKQGPLPVHEAVARILDIIEGLQEAHRGGVIHRDVKPSNCFLDADGRVKVGDFGLAKSLIGPEHLTQSGTFLGTLLFASPEQIRNDQVNHLTDVYSVCATLYYLLTGRAPFQDTDAAATLARTVSDPLTPMRRHRPDLPATLDEVVLRGLARSRRQRWQSMEDLRLALLPFVAVTHSLDEIGWRVSAYLCDALLLVPLELLVQRLLRLGHLDGSAQGPIGAMLGSLLISIGCGMAYFAVPEAVWGCSVGKFLMRLRVRTVARNDRPSLWRSGLRTLCFYLFKDCLVVVVALFLLLRGAPRFGEMTITPRMVMMLALLGILPFLSSGLGLLILTVSMRRRNGFRGLHEWMSGTRVIRLPGLRRHFGAPALRPLPEKAALPAGVPERVGVFAVRALVRDAGDEQVLYGEDSALGRPVWLWLRKEETLLPARRREIARATRSRWLAGGQQDGWTWDAFVAAPGCLLADLVPHKRRLGWLDTLSVLEQLTDELLAAIADGTLPTHLGPEQVWVQASGQAILLDVAPRAGSPSVPPLDLLRQTAAIALEGKPRSAADLPRPIWAPIPGHAHELLARLMGGKDSFETLEEVSSALSQAHERPEEISRPGRGLQVAFTAIALWPGLLMMFLLGPVLLLVAFALCVVGKAFCDVEVETAEVHLHLARVDVVARPDVPGKLAAVGWMQGEHRRRAELHDRLKQLERERQIVLGSVSWFIKRGLSPVEAQFQQYYTELIRDLADDEEMRDEDLLAGLGDDMTAGPAPLAGLGLEESLYILLAVAACPLLWSLWAGLLRGGIGLRLAGISLLGKGGKPAARWRCVWRSLLVWLPVAGLLSASILLDVWRLAEAGAGWSNDELRVTGWLAWATWWLALLLLPLYVWVAIRWPNGGPHDRLAGTYPVPR